MMECRVKLPYVLIAVMLLLVASCANDIPELRSGEETLSLSLRVLSKDVTTRSEMSDEGIGLTIDSDSDIDLSDFYLLTFTQTGELIDCFPKGDVSDSDLSVTKDADGSLSADCKLEASKYLGKGDIRFVVMANGKGLGNSGFNLGGIKNYEELRTLSFCLQSAGADDMDGSSPTYIPMYGEQIVKASRFARHNINLEVGIEKCVAKIEIIDCLEAAEIVSVTMTKGRAKGYYVISDSNVDAEDICTYNAGETGNSNAENVEINFFSKELAEGKRQYYAFLPEMNLPSDAKSEERKIDLIIKETDGVETSYSLWLAPYDKETKSVVEGEVTDSKWQKLRHNNIYRFTVSGINIPENPEPEIEVLDKILILWHEGHKSGKFYVKGGNYSCIRIEDSENDFEIFDQQRVIKGEPVYLSLNHPGVTEYLFYYLIDNSSLNIDLDKLYYQMYNGMSNAVGSVNSVMKDKVRIENMTFEGIKNLSGEYTCIFLTDFAIKKYMDFFPTDHMYRFYTKSDQFDDLRIVKFNGGKLVYVYPESGEYLKYETDSRGYRYFTFLAAPDSFSVYNKILYQSYDMGDYSTKDIYGEDIFLQHIEGEGDFYVYYLD